MALPRGVVPERPAPGQESVWDYPRPPRVEPTAEHVVVTLGRRVVVETRRALRVLETSHPPTYYLPMADADPLAFRPAAGRSVCEWKGVAAYLDVLAGDGPDDEIAEVAAAAAWTYPDPLPPFAQLADHLALYPGRMTSVTVDGEPVRAQQGGFYGGWVTDRVVGPFKGAPGSTGW